MNMKKESETVGVALLAILGAFTLAPCLIASAAVLDGWVLSILWHWFMVPQFHLPPLRIPNAIGLSMIVAITAHQYQSHEGIKGWKLALHVLLKPLIALLAGWIVTWFL